MTSTDDTGTPDPRDLANLQLDTQHTLGDLLRAAADALQPHFRKSPDNEADTAWDRADELRQRLQNQREQLSALGCGLARQLENDVRREPSSLNADAADTSPLHPYTLLGRTMEILYLAEFVLYLVRDDERVQHEGGLRRRWQASDMRLPPADLVKAVLIRLEWRDLDYRRAASQRDPTHRTSRPREHV